jgi:short-subunit dehydrogenase
VDTRTVARQTLDAAEKGRAVVIPGWINQMIYGVSRLMPASVTARIAGGRWRAAQQVRDPWKEYQKELKAI